MEPILLLVNSAPSSPNLKRAFGSALALKEQGHPVSMFLLQDAVLAGLREEGLDRSQPNSSGAHPHAAQALNAGVSLYSLVEDLALRGYAASNLWDGIQAGDYGQLVDLFDRHTRVIGTL